jgi:hypothetical protein
LFLWPVPTTAFDVSLELWQALGGNTDLTTALVLAPGYQQALSLSLAEALFVPFGAQPNPLTLSRAARARAVIETTNADPPPLMTLDYGLGSQSRTPYYNYLIGPLSGRQ